jgi:uncharacterized coiled-coil protein SlyX
MRRITFVLSAASLAALLLAPTPAAAQSQDIENLRRRVEDVERQLFQQRLATPMSPQGQSYERLQMRLDHLEQRLASEQISRVASDVTAKGSAGVAPKALDTRIAELEQARAADAKLIEKLTARIEALEKAAKPPVRRK